MGFLSKVEGRMEDVVEGAANRVSDTPLSPVQIAKKAEKQMRRNKMVGAGKQYAPTLYTILVSEEDDSRLFGYYPTLAGETETYLAAKAAESGLIMDGQPLVRFIVDDDLKHGKFDVVAELVAAPLVDQLREEEMERYGISDPRSYRKSSKRAATAYSSPAEPAPTHVPVAQAQPIDYGVPVSQSAASAASPLDDPASYRVPTPPTAAPMNPIPASVPVQSAAAPGMAPIPPGAPVPQGAEAIPPTMTFAAATAAPSPTREAGLQAYLYDITNDRAFTLTGIRMRIGRGSSNEIVIPDINASRLHAEIREDVNGDWLLTDLDSTNGTLVNGRLIKTVKLKDADRITMGTTELEFQLI